MRLETLLAVGLAVLLVGAGAAAAAPPSDHASDRAADATADEPDDDRANDDHHADAANRSANATNASASEQSRRGPPVEMPAPVPDHVSRIHELVGQFLEGSIDDLGAAVSDLVGGDDPDASAAPA